MIQAINRPAHIESPERLTLASMNISIDAMTAACRSDLLDVDLLQLRGSPFFPGLTAAFDHFLHVQYPPWEIRRDDAGLLHPMFLSYYIFKLWQYPQMDFHWKSMKAV